MTDQEDNPLQIHTRHVRWFVNFFAEPSLLGEELDSICSNLTGKLEQSLVEDPSVDKLSISVEIEWSNIAEMNLGEMTWLDAVAAVVWARIRSGPKVSTQCRATSSW